jgi:peptidoglycan endopeptidase LytF
MAVKQVVTPKPVPVVKPKTYTVVAGDTLTLIAAKFKVTVAKLMALNKLSNSNQISIGQVLKLS